MITHFTIQFPSKNLTHSTNLNSLDIENYNAPATQSKTFLTLQTFQQRSFCLVSEKKFALHHFLAPKNYILEALWKQMSVYFSISPSENLCSKDIVRFYYMGGGLGGGRRLNNFLKATRCFGLVKCFSIFHFNWNVWKFNYF